MDLRTLIGLCTAGMMVPFAAGTPGPSTGQGRSKDQYLIPVLVLHFFPTNGTNLDLRLTGDVGSPLETIRQKTQRQTQEALAALEEGSRYGAFRDPTATPTLKYQVVGTQEFLEPLPNWNKPGHKTPMTDYRRILDRVNIRDWVEQKGVKEVWIWGYHGGKVDLWESNMASRFGDVSNSDRDPNDLPVFSKTYTVYH